MDWKPALRQEEDNDGDEHRDKRPEQVEALKAVCPVEFALHTVSTLSAM
jgi:hypothetical protein